MVIYAKSRKTQSGLKYEATAEYSEGLVTVKKGSKINRRHENALNGKRKVEKLWGDNSLFKNETFLKHDVTFKSLSKAATFVTGNVANGNIVWKCKDGRPIGEVLKVEGDINGNV